jgi:CRISPR-associated protein Cmr4
MSNDLQSHYLVQRYLLMTLDPLHIGTGGYRLGRVDLSIVREPGTRLPKIPGTSLHGAARSYAAYLYGTPEAAGQSQEKITHPEQNPVCYTFGYIKGKNPDGSEQKAYSGVVNVTDAHILLFPVHSVAGPVWVSTPQRLKDAGFQNVTPESLPDGEVYLTWNHTGRLNLGWLMLDVAGQTTVTPPEVWKNDPRWTAVQNRIALVSDGIFSHIVNSNLEVRTSVSIDPHTGAAAEGALFTYEALPRAAFLTAEVVLDEYQAENRPRPFPVEKTHTGQSLSEAWQGPLDVVQAGLKMMEFLGLGGMGTRGFGRIRIVGNPIEINLIEQTAAQNDQKQEAAQ